MLLLVCEPPHNYFTMNIRTWTKYKYINKRVYLYSSSSLFSCGGCSWLFRCPRCFVHHDTLARCTARMIRMCRPNVTHAIIILRKRLVACVATKPNALMNQHVLGQRSCMEKHLIALVTLVLAHFRMGGQMPLQQIVPTEIQSAHVAFERFLAGMNAFVFHQWRNVCKPFGTLLALLPLHRCRMFGQPMFGQLPLTIEYAIYTTIGASTLLAMPFQVLHALKWTRTLWTHDGGQFANVSGIFSDRMIIAQRTSRVRNTFRTRFGGHISFGLRLRRTLLFVYFDGAKATIGSMTFWAGKYGGKFVLLILMLLE